MRVHRWKFIGIKEFTEVWPGTRGAVYVMLCHFIRGSASAVLQLQAFHVALVVDVHRAVSQYDLSRSPVKVHLKGCVNINVK